MKKFLISILLMVTAISITVNAQTRFQPYAVSPRKIEIGSQPQITLCKGGKADFEVVKPVNSAADKAVAELISRLYQITGKKVKPVQKASGKVPAFYLGVCPEAEKLGLNPEKLDRDGYYIKTDGNRIFITGCDGGKGIKYQCATLYGVYDFLERFAGVRYYFPGEMGTLVPKKKDWSLPAISITERPDMQFRIIYCYACGRLDTSKYNYPGLTKDQWNPTFWRNSTNRSMGSSHGLNRLELAKRFAKTHPEYFALTTDGRRHDGTYLTRKSQIYGHLCFSSEGLKEVIYQDAVAALTGQPPSSRGLSRWSTVWNQEVVNLAPNDGLYWCQCPVCKKIQEQGKQAMSDHIWQFRADIANRLKKNNIPGFVTCSSYGVFSEMPSMKLPDNISVGVAVPGPWGMNNAPVRTKADQRIRAWSGCLKHKINSWTYPTKACALIGAVPNFTPRAVAAFYRSQKDHLFGGFFEAGSDHWMYGFLNCYVFSKFTWDNSCDVEALIDEHCRLMYGPAAPLMNRFYQELEDLWMNNIVKESIPSSYGDHWKLPTQYEVWTKIYSPEKIKEISALLDQAEKAAAAKPEALKRVKFMRQELWQPVVEAAETFCKEFSDRSAWNLYASEAKEIILDGKLDEKVWEKAEAVWLNVNRPVTKTGVAKVEVQTRVKMLQDADNFYFGIEADEPETDRMIDSKRKHDDSELWRDNGMEIFLSADLTSQFIYQFIFNSAGSKSDSKNDLYQLDRKYESGFEVKTQTVPGKMWTAEIRIPRKALPELEGKKQIVGNFSRNRVLKDRKLGSSFYVWFPKNQNIPENCGLIQLEKQGKPVNLLKTGDFDQPPTKHHIGAWAGGKAVHADKEIFLTKGVSMRLEGNATKAMQSVPMEPGKRYKLSVYVRTEDLHPGFRGVIRFGGNPAPAFQLLNDYRIYVSGTNYWWRRYSKTFKAPENFGTKYKPSITFSIGKSTGKCWIDHAELVELK